MAEEGPGVHIFARRCNIHEDLHERIDLGSVSVGRDERTWTPTVAPLPTLTLR
jgi:hypothetical protein